MGEKRCSTCRSIKPLDDFAVSRTRRDGRQARCRSCCRDWYTSNREQAIATVGRRRAQVRPEHLALLEQHLLENPCVDCGERDLRVLDVDHEDRTTKVADVARLTSMNIAWERIEAEIAKCSVRCASCHRRRTAAQFGYWRSSAEERRSSSLTAAAAARLAALTAGGGTME